MKGYGSTATPPGGDGGSSYGHTATARSLSLDRSQRALGALPRNESVGISTVETEPLLGEQLLLGSEDPFFPTSDVEVDTVGGSNRMTPTRSGSPRKKLHSLGSDPHIGHSVTTNEVDTLAYSRDDLSLLTRVRPAEGPLRGWLRRLCARGGGRSDPPFLLLCLGLAVGVAISGIGAISYDYYYHEKVLLATEEDAASSEGTWHGVPYSKIGRESFGDPVSGIIDEALFHPSLLFDKNEGTNAGKRAKADLARTRKGDAQHDLAHDAVPTPFLRVAFPTGAFWTNLVLLPQNDDPSARDPNQYSYPVVAYPFSFQWSALGKLQASYSAARRVVHSNRIQDGFAPDVTVGAVEEMRARHVVGFDSVSVTLRFYSCAADDGSGSGSGSGSGGGHGTWDTYLVQGSPYVTARYDGLSPELTALSDFDDIACPPTFHGEDPAQFQQPSRGDERLKSSGISDKTTAIPPTIGKKTGHLRNHAELVGTEEDRGGRAIRRHDAGKINLAGKIVVGAQFVVTTQEFFYQEDFFDLFNFQVFASEPISFEFDQAARRTIRALKPFGGVLRLALVPPPASSSGGTATASSEFAHLASSPGVKRLIYHAGAYPIGGSVSWSFRSGARLPLASSPFPRVPPNKAGHRRAAAEAPKENNIGTLAFAFDTVQMHPSNSDVPLLTLVLPHHARAIDSADELLLREKDFDLAYHSIKGRMVPVVGNTWSYEEELTFAGFGDAALPAKTNLAQHSTASDGGNRAMSRRPLLDETTALRTLDPSVRALLLRTVEADLTVNLPVLSDGAYGFGKQIARIAQLAHVASVVDAADAKVAPWADGTGTAKNDTHVHTAHPASSTAGSGTARRAYALLEKYLTMWLVGDGGDKHLVYDAQLGGILSMLGLSDVNADFGNARYNDHHFHYGYVLYAAAILGRANPKFVSQYGPFVDALFYDVARPPDSAGDRDLFFPLARHKSWFDGHSLASGLFPSADGKSQESSSEAVNCYYGAYLWARVRWGGAGDESLRKIDLDGNRMVDFARLLLAMEMTGAKTYWHMTPPKEGASGNITTALPNEDDTNSIPMAYNAAFRQNYMVGNLGMTDVTCTTWFGTKDIYVHLINFLPVTAITAELFDKRYVEGEQSMLGTSEAPEKAWDGYVICNKAIVDPNSAWVEAQRLVSSQLDVGVSKSQVLFWVSTRDGFAAGTTVEGHPNKNSSAMAGEDTEFLTSCSSHEGCVAAKLVGDCCPTNKGIFLGCC